MTTESITYEALSNSESTAKQKIKAIFCEIDDSGNGWVERDEFRKFITELGIDMADADFNHLLEEIDTDRSGHIDFEEFFKYYYNLLLDSDNNDQEKRIIENLLKHGVLKEIDLDVQEQKRVAKLQRVFKQLKFKAHSNSNTDLQDLIKRNRHFRESESIDAFDEKLLLLYQDTEVEELSGFIEERWNAFINFKRQGRSGDSVMETDANDVTDALPGDYDLVQLVMSQYDIVPDMKTPEHVVLNGVKWTKAEPGGADGKLVCDNWDGTIPVDIGTNQFVGYYGACLAGEKQEKVALLQRHCTVDFDYAKSYHDDYVISTCGGNGMEKHAFHHMDCPLDNDSGFFILGKMVGKDDMHLTAFKIPKNHVLYVPPNTIHSNDHLIGVWRTMLSDCKDAPVDHVMMYTRKDGQSDELEHVDVKFETSIGHFGAAVKIRTCKKCEN